MNRGIIYQPRQDTTPEAEISSLVACYRIILDGAKQRGRIPDRSGPEDVKGRSENDFHAKTSIHE